jgi:hypothetical protein
LGADYREIVILFRGQLLAECCVTFFLYSAGKY